MGLAACVEHMGKPEPWPLWKCQEERHTLVTPNQFKAKKHIDPMADD